MNWDQIEGGWKEFRGKLKSDFGKLTDDDFQRLSGKRDEIVGAVQRRYGIEKDDAKNRVEKWADSLKDAIKGS